MKGPKKKMYIFSHQILITSCKIGFTNRDQRKFMRFRVREEMRGGSFQMFKIPEEKVY